MSQSTPLVLALSSQARVPTFADGCRAAALDFVNQVALTDDKAQLAAWLRGPYRAHSVALARSRTKRLTPARVVPGALAALLERTRYEVLLGMMRARETEDGIGFGFTALNAGHVYRCQDVDGTPGWVPVAQPRMRLADRVLSLVAADYLLRSDDYEASFYTCSACGLAEFDAERKALGICDAHAHSDIRELAPSHDTLDEYRPTDVGEDAREIA
jgi:hypothetical protein